ncbi:MAG: MFS transporter [Dehalococcoidia bacterium]|nr:MFS transporter [Dehalococcoidia bacterium]
MLFLFSITWGLGIASKGQDLGWTSPLIMGLIFVAVVFLFIFFRLEHVLPHPMLDLSLFRSRLFTAATISALLNYLCVFAGLFLVPFYLVQGRGFAPSLAGLLITAQPVAMVISAPISGYLSDRIGSRLLSTGGMVILAAGMFTLHGLGAESSAWQIVLPLALTGLGTGLFVSPNNSAILGSAPRHRQGITSGILATARNLGMVFGVAVSGAIFGMQMAQRSAGQAGSPTAFFGAFQDTFIVIAVIAIIGAATSLVRGPATPRTS